MREYNGVSIHGLTRKDFKKLKLDDYGYGFYSMSEPPEGKTPEECIEKFVLACTRSKAEILDDFTPGQVRKLYMECIKETYGAVDEEKNS